MITRITSIKADRIQDKGYKDTGHVLKNETGDVCIVDDGDVRWLSKDEFWNLMHPDEKKEIVNREKLAKEVSDISSLLHAGKS